MAMLGMAMAMLGMEDQSILSAWQARANGLHS
jgi:hypothetical protein